MIEAACDSLLDSLVANFDDEELPYRREERLLALIKEEDGDRDAAKLLSRARQLMEIPTVKPRLVQTENGWEITRD